MAGGKSKVVAAQHAEAHDYEFMGPWGALVISIGLPVVTYLMTFLCNDIAGCPVPSILHPSTLTLDKLKAEAGWPADGIWGLASFKVTGYVLAYYLFSLVLWRVLPGEAVEGTTTPSGVRLKYKFNTFSSSAFTVVLCIAGTVAQGASFPVWTFIWDNYLQILTVNTIIAYMLATYVYVASFSVKPFNRDQRELAPHGISGNMLYDWFIGRELNPRVTLPLLGEIDIKVFCELRPGMLGWLLINYASMAHQYAAHGVVTDSIILVSAVQTLYVFDAYYMESAMLTTMDITTDGFGFMLAFGDLVWLPFTYSLQAKYLAVYPLSIGPWGVAGVLAPLAVGYYIFRSANNEKNRFRTDPSDPRIAHLKYIETASGSRLLVSGWWGASRHPNYLGDWIMSWAYVLPTGIAGYLILPDGGGVVQGEARGWGMVVTYFYMLYFAILLIHRELRDEDKCLRKYGDDWHQYTKTVKWRIVPYVY